MNRATFYKLRMTNGDVHVTTTNPRHLTGDWAIIPAYVGGLLTGIWWKDDTPLHIRPAHIVSYTIFDDDLDDD